jgi:hypothetical protein
VKTGDWETNDVETSSGRNENVVRLPREWIGPLEELVPIRPATEAGKQSTGSVEDEVPPTADAFWSEDAGALHNALQAPAGPPSEFAEHEPTQSGPALGVRRRSRLLAGLPLAAIPVRRPAITIPQGRHVAVALTLLAVIAVGAGLSVTPQSTPWSSTGRSSGHNEGIAELDRAKAAMLASLARASATDHAAPSTPRIHRRSTRKHPRTRHPRAHPTATTAASARATSGYTPPPLSASGATSSSGSSSSGGSETGSGTPSPPAPAAHPSSTNAGTTSAFGSSGALGPGSSPNG